MRWSFANLAKMGKLVHTTIRWALPNPALSRTHACFHAPAMVMVNLMTPTRNLPRFMRRATLAVLAALLLSVPLSAQDTVTLKTGRKLTGKILSENETTVDIQAGGVTMSLQRSEIATMQREGEAVVSSTDQAVANATSRLAGGEPLLAWTELSSVASDSKGLAPHTQLILDVGSAVFQNAKRDNEAKNPEVGLKKLEALLSPEGRKLLQLSGTPAESVQAAMDATKIEIINKGRRLTSEGNALVTTDKSGPEPERIFREAMTLLPPSDPDYFVAQTQLARNLGFRAFELRDKPDSAATVTALVDEALTLLDQVLQAKGVDPSVTSEASLSRAALRDAGFRHSSEPQVTGLILEEGTFDGSLESPSKIVDFLKSKGVELTPEQSRTISNALWPIGIFIVVFWLLPWVILRALESRGNIFASARRRQVKFLGPLALILAMKDASPVAAGEADHACPHCKLTLDNPDMYPELNFSACPHCKKPIQPVHTMMKYMSDLSTSLRNEGERVDKGAIGLNEMLKNNRMERIIQVILTESVRRRSSDIHLEPEEKGLRIRLRIDGVMTELFTFPKSLANSITSAIKVRANLDVSDKMRPQDGVFLYEVDNAKIDARVASSPSPHGEKLSLRLLDVRSLAMSGKKLGMTVSQREIFDKCIRLPHGLILNTGPTGSGKTTTLYIALQKIRDEDRNILSIEDPIEFRIPGINQMQVNPTAGLTFATGLRSILRQDPDVIMIGEIRDRETAEIAIEAATTGHLVFSTLHTIDSAAAMSRLMEFGITPRRFADSLNLVISQRLCRLVCPECRKMHRPTADELAMLQLDPASFDPVDFAVAAGCHLCNETGYFGRSGLFELLLATDEIRSALESGNLTTVEIRNLAIKCGMLTLRQHGVELVKKGLTTVEEVTRVSR